MIATAARTTLDRKLANVGQDVELQRLSSPSMTVAAAVTLRAHIVDFKPQELLGGNGLQAGDSRVIISTTEIDAAQWPSALESRLPRKGDRVIVAGRTRTVLFAWPAPYIEDELVRVELAVR